MDIRTELGRRILFCDGAMGTMLQAAGLPAGAGAGALEPGASRGGPRPPRAISGRRSGHRSPPIPLEPTA
ncbi:MAG: hypothetical protein ACLSAF_04075 [Intestinimonas sp.]